MNNSRPFDLRIERDRRIADNAIPGFDGVTGRPSPRRLPRDVAAAFDEAGAPAKALWPHIDGRRTVLDIAERCQTEGGTVNLRGLLRALRATATLGLVSLRYARTFTADDILSGLRALGIREGDTLMAHSSLAAIGPVDGGARAVIGALQRAVGPLGTLALPTFTFSIVECCPDAPYNPATTPSRTGALTNVFRTMPGVIRSHNPSHSFAAWGAGAEAIVRGNMPYGACDIRGAFGALYRMDAVILFLGTGFGPNTTLHAVEDWAGLPSMKTATFHYMDASGRRCEISYLKCPFQHRSFYTGELTSAERMLREAGVTREGDIGLARSFTVPLRAVVDLSLDALEAGNLDIMFCSDPGCEECLRHREQMQTWSMPEGLRERLKAMKAPGNAERPLGLTHFRNRC